MPYQPKIDAPESVWIDLTASLQAFFTPADPEWTFYLNVLAAFVSPRLVLVQDLADHGDYSCVQPDVSDYLSGAFLDMLWNYAYQRALAEFTEDA